MGSGAGFVPLVGIGVEDLYAGSDKLAMQALILV